VSHSRNERASQSYDAAAERDPHATESKTEGKPGAAAAQPAAADAAEIPLPHGQQVIVVPVTPGETVELPTDTEQGLLAEIGPQGNLAFVIDGRTIILQGYAEADDQSPVTILTGDGERVDVAAVVAATDPSIDIQTAAGPAAGPQGNNPATGTGIFVPFPEGAGLGGFDAAGVLNGTALQYKLITDQTKLFDIDDERFASGIHNSVPTANPDSATVTQSAAVDYQLMLVIDVSGSMKEQVTRPDGTVTTRMQLQKEGVATLLESYATAATGSVNVKMVQFSDGASYFGGTSQSGFVDIADPANLAAIIAAINGLHPTNNTDYDAALATAQLGITDASWLASDANTKGLVYFFSDGRPVNDGDKASSYPGGDAANRIDQTEEDIWEGRTPAAGFENGLADKGVVSIAVGLGADIANDVLALHQLERVAYYSEAFPDQSVVVVNDENQLAGQVIQTVPATVTGNVLTNDDPGADGFGDPHIAAISAVIDADTTSQTVTDTATGFKIETNNGILVIDTTTGDFSYTAAPGSGGHVDSFIYTIQDGAGGDTDSATLAVTIAPLTLVHGTTPFDGTDGGDFITGDDSNNVISAAAGTDTVQGGYGNDTIDGGKGDDALYGQEGNDILAGGDGNDMLLGGNADDSLNGGSGINALSGGGGNDLLDGGQDTVADILSGGLGDDVLVWRGVEDTYDGGLDTFSAAGGDPGDILDISKAADIDFTAIDDGKIESIETLRMTGGSGTAVTLNAADVISDFGGGGFNPGGHGSGGSYDGRPVLRVDGDAGDTVNLTGGGWSQAAGATGVPAGYTLYIHDAGGSPGAAEDAYVLVQKGVHAST
jgi:Ca2+-binding RTX toxin-like protein